MPEKAKVREYQIDAKGSWEQIAGVIGKTKELVGETLPFDSQITPQYGESFLGYRLRMKKNLRLDTSFGFNLRKEGSILLVELKITERSYHSKIDANGEYATIGKLIATGLKNYLETNIINHECKAFDELI